MGNTWNGANTFDPLVDQPIKNPDGSITGYATGGMVSNSILDLNPEDFNFALKELGLPENEALELMKQYRDKNSVFPTSPEWLKSDPNSNTSSYFPVKVPKGKSIVEGIKEGTWNWAIPESLTSESTKPVLDAIETPANLLKGIPYTDQELQQNAMIGAGLAGTGGFAASAASEIPQDAMGIFAGIRSPKANISALEEAERMAANGSYTPEEIFTSTGWFQGLDGEWKWEIPDDKTSFEDALDWMAPGENTYEGGSFLDITHPELNKAYPNAYHLQDLDITLNHDNTKTGVSGYYQQPFGDKGKISLTASDNESFKEGLIHEFQHGVQAAENWSGKGTNPDYIYNQIASTFDNMPAEVISFAKTVSTIRYQTKLVNETKDYLNKINSSNNPKGWEIASSEFDQDDIDYWKETLPEMIATKEDLLQFAAKEAAIIGSSYASKIIDLFEIINDWSFNKDDYSDSFNKRRADDMYRNEKGEVEARAAAKRRDLPIKERVTRYPSLDYDPPEGGGKYWDGEAFKRLLDSLQSETENYLQSINRHNEVR